MDGADTDFLSHPGLNSPHLIELLLDILEGPMPTITKGAWQQQDETP